MRLEVLRSIWLSWLWHLYIRQVRIARAEIVQASSLGERVRIAQTDPQCYEKLNLSELRNEKMFSISSIKRCEFLQQWVSNKTGMQRASRDAYLHE